MANRGYLLNTSVLTSDFYELARRRNEPGVQCEEVAESAYRIPIPWSCCFQPEDLRMVTMEYDEDDGKPPEGCPAQIALPCTTVVKAIENLKQALPVFVQLAGNERYGREYWQDALDTLEALTLPYLTMNPVEVIFTSDPMADAKALAESLGGRPEAVPAMIQLSGYVEGEPTYPIDILYNIPGPNLHEPSNDNSVALNLGGSGASLGPAAERLEQMPLRAIDRQMQALLKKHGYTARSHYGFTPLMAGRNQQLKCALFTDTVLQADLICHDQALREELDGPIYLALRKTCKSYGLDWLGFVFIATEAIKRDHKGKYDVWLTLPVAQPFGAPTPLLAPAPPLPRPKPAAEATAPAPAAQPLGTAATPVAAGNRKALLNIAHVVPVILVDVQWPRRCARCGSTVNLVTAPAMIGVTESVRPTLHGTWRVESSTLHFSYPICARHQTLATVGMWVNRKSPALALIRGVFWFTAPITLAVILRTLTNHPLRNGLDVSPWLILASATGISTMLFFRRWVPVRPLRWDEGVLDLYFTDTSYARDFVAANPEQTAADSVKRTPWNSPRNLARLGLLLLIVVMVVYLFHQLNQT